MELKEFIKETLVHILKGVETAQTEEFPNHGRVGESMYGLTVVKFDIAVTTIDTEGKSAKAGIFVGGFAGLGVKKDDGQSTQAHNRIQFEIPVQLPIGDSSE